MSVERLVGAFLLAAVAVWALVTAVSLWRASPRPQRARRGRPAHPSGSCRFSHLVVASCQQANAQPVSVWVGVTAVLALRDDGTVAIDAVGCVRSRKLAASLREAADLVDRSPDGFIAPGVAL